MGKLTLAQFGLTPEAIRRHVVSIDPPVQTSDLDWIKVARAKQKAQRQANLAAGLTSHGTPRIRKIIPKLLGVVRNPKKSP